MEKKTLALKLLELRQKHNLTQKELCAKLNIGRATYSYYETGNRVPDISTLLLIAQYYHISLDELVSDKPYQDKKITATEEDTEIPMIHHLKSKHIPVNAVLELSKAEFDFLYEFRKLTPENKEEIQYLVNYKIRKQEKQSKM